jgi:hypothetical protein
MAPAPVREAAAIAVLEGARQRITIVFPMCIVEATQVLGDNGLLALCYGAVGLFPGDLAVARPGVKDLLDFSFSESLLVMPEAHTA